MKSSTLKSTFLFALLAVCSAPFAISADQIKGEQVCDKLKTCALESLEGEDAPEQMKQVLMTQLDTQCAQSFSDKEQAFVDAGLVDQANACIDEMLSMSCQELMVSGNANKSKACKEFKDASKEAGIED